MIDINRRSFLFGSAAAATLAGCSTSKVGARELKPGEKRNVAMIGIGIQGRFLLTEFLKQPNVRVVAICDVDKTRREDSAAKVNAYYIVFVIGNIDILVDRNDVRLVCERYIPMSTLP